jgi:hypothetical protein
VLEATSEEAGPENLRSLSDAILARIGKGTPIRVAFPTVYCQPWPTGQLLSGSPSVPLCQPG